MMDDGTTPSAEHEKPNFVQRHRIGFLVAAAVVISLISVTVSLAIYNLSGSAQLDLSRPGFQAVSDQVARTNTIDEYSGSGDVTLESIDEFLKLYDEQAAKAKAVDAFNGDPLNPEVLEFSTVASQ